MTFIASVFTKKSDLDGAIKDVFERGYGADEIILMRNNGKYGDGQIERSDFASIPNPVIGLTRPNTGLPIGGPGVATSTENLTEELDISQEELSYYSRLADSGAVIMFVSIDDSDQDEVRKMLESHHPSRIDILN